MAQEEVEVKTEDLKVPNLINKHIKDNNKFFSFEYYPPKTDKGVENLKKRLHRMNGWSPQWMDVTWGAGGTTSDLTPQICDFIQNNVKGNCMMHLTCTNMPKEKIDIALEKAKKMGLRNILALRGDPPEGQKEFKAIENGFSCALDLIKYIKSKPEYKDYFAITVSGYPEGHPLVRKKILDQNGKPIKSDNAPLNYWAPRKDKDGDWEGVSSDDWQNELDYLKKKIDAGGQVIITQLFYDYDIFIGFVKKARALGIKVPILPGIMPIRNVGAFERMTGFCRTVIPSDLQTKLNEFKEHSVKDSDVLEYGVKYIVSLCEKLLNAKDVNGAPVIPGVHLYTMNLEYSTIAILKGLNLGEIDTINKEYQSVNDARLAKLKEKENKAKQENTPQVSPTKEQHPMGTVNNKNNNNNNNKSTTNQGGFKPVATF